MSANRSRSRSPAAKRSKKLVPEEEIVDVLKAGELSRKKLIRHFSAGVEMRPEELRELMVKVDAVARRRTVYLEGGKKITYFSLK